ncbi:hypothetical protein BDU57DRAFT_577407 [Ampelomyces quisqualis]|uniref:Survival protein SurE-like phosphatase/nucleotidase domain-containing protein n=1 Tax=Ampelomyces quisqualis TaxID=50730 RepID=A0A6A5QIR1_AMPQU|nr:hypothetical protein BDU57DRAFT_577407 [Ampelomyces quisqualis]
MLKFYLLLAIYIALPLTQAARLLITGVDGWDDSNIRLLFKLLDRTTDHELILCAPEQATQGGLRRFGPNNNIDVPDNELMSDDGSLWSDGDSLLSEVSLPDKPRPIFDDDIENDSLPKKLWDPIADRERFEQHSAHWKWGFDPSDFRLNYVPSGFTGMRIAIDRAVEYLTPVLYQHRDSDPPLPSPPELPRIYPDLLLVGPMIGDTLGHNRFDYTGTIIRSYAKDGHPIISFAGPTGSHFNPDRPNEHREWSKIYAQLAKHITETVIKSRKPYLPEGTYLNVNFPYIDFVNQRCSNVRDFKFILTSHFRGDSGVLSYMHCGQWGFPFETEVVDRDDGCYVAITLGRSPSDWFGSEKPGVFDRQDVIGRLKPILECLPKNQPLATEKSR